MKTSVKSQEGMALVFAVLAIILIAAATMLVMGSVQNSKNSTDYAENEVELEEACKAGIDLGIEQVWSQYLAGRNNVPGCLTSYFDFIDGIVDNNEDVNGNGTRDGDEKDSDGDGTFEIADPVNLISPGEPRELAGGARITGLTLSRTDDITGTTLTLRATSESGEWSRTATQSVRVSGEPFHGFEFAVLANNINCILCHAQFHSLELSRNTDADLYNTFNRIKVASLESLLIRPTEAESEVAGTVYTRGKVYNQSGGLLNASQVKSSTLDSYQTSTVNGKIKQNTATGAMTEKDLVNATTNDEGLLNKYANLYLEYPSDKSTMTDGPLPEDFPAPFPDDNGNRYVDGDEFEKFMQSANGSVTFDGSDGVAYGVPEGSTYGGNALPNDSNDALNGLAAGHYDGNLFLLGTQSDPIVIEDDVAIDGDLVLAGPVKGSGQLMVSGNVYVVGDVTYADGSGEFGLAADGTENAFGLAAGGSIMIGDYLLIRAKNNIKDGGRWNPDYVDTGVWQGHFTRMDKEHYDQKMSNGEYTQVGYFDPGVVDVGYAQGSGSKKEGQYSFATSEIMLFNRMERQKWAPPGHPDYNSKYYIPDYTPRYYRLKTGAPIYQYVQSKVVDSNLIEHSVNYLSPGVEIIPENGLGNAAIHVLGSKNGWLPENTLRKIWWNDEAVRRARGGKQPWRFDGLLYTNNAILGVTRGYGRHKSATYGTMYVRGAMVCADIGLLITDSDDREGTGLRLFYDRRVNAFLHIEDTTQVQFARLTYQYERGQDDHTE